MARVSMTEQGRVAGIWASTSNGDSIGLIADDKAGVYLAIYPKGKSLPYAIGTTKTGGEVDVQVPGEDIKSVKMFNIHDLVAALEEKQRISDIGK